MFYNVALALKTIFEAEMVAGGKLEGLAALYVGEYKILPEGDFPVLIIYPDSASLQGYAAKKTLEVEITLLLASICPTYDDSMEDISDLVLDLPAKTGIVPVLDASRSLTADGQRWNLREESPWSISREKESDKSPRALWVASCTQKWQSIVTI